MKQKHWVIKSIFAIIIVYSSGSQALTLDLYDYVINTDGVIDAGVPGSVDPLSLGLDANGLGILSFTMSGTGSHSFSSFFDFEFDEANNTFFNESGSANGALAAGQSWEIDEPGYVFGDIYDNVLENTLDNTNAVPAGLEEDVSFALGWDFTLAEGETATITLILSDILNTSGFYLQHTDDEVGASFDLSESVYFWSELSIEDAATVPEPSILSLLAVSSLGLIGFARRKKA